MQRLKALCFQSQKTDSLIDIQGKTGLLSSRFKLHYFNSGRLSRGRFFSRLLWRAREILEGLDDSTSKWRSLHDKDFKEHYSSDAPQTFW